MRRLLDGLYNSAAALAALALMRLKWGVMPVIGLCALVGLLLRLSGLA